LSKKLGKTNVADAKANPNTTSILEKELATLPVGHACILKTGVNVLHVKSSATAHMRLTTSEASNPMELRKVAISANNSQATKAYIIH